MCSKSSSSSAPVKSTRACDGSTQWKPRICLSLPSARARCPELIDAKDDTDAADSYHEGAPSDSGRNETRRVAGMAGFLGLPPERQLVRDALARARRERRPTVVVVDGEPGVGKSRLIDEASRNTRADRVAVSAHEPEMSLPFSLRHAPTRAP